MWSCSFSSYIIETFKLYSNAWILLAVSRQNAGGIVQEPGPALYRGGGVSKAELAAVLNFTTF